MFCPKCKSVLLPKKEGLVCVRCGYKEKGKKGKLMRETIGEEKRVEVIQKEEAEHLPLDKDMECPKCKHQGAYYWEVQTRAADEPATRFFRCEKCKHTWREYD